MATAEQNLTDWYQGEARVFEFTVKDDAGAAMDITGWNVKWELRVNIADVTPALTKTAVITAATTGKLEVRIAKADTQEPGGTLDPGTFFYGLARTDAGNENVLAFGTATLSASAVRP